MSHDRFNIILRAVKTQIYIVWLVVECSLILPFSLGNCEISFPLTALLISLEIAPKLWLRIPNSNGGYRKRVLLVVIEIKDSPVLEESGIHLHL